MKSTLIACAVLVLASLAAVHRWGDSAHAMGVLSLGGGRARHPVHLPAGRSRYTLVVTATVAPPYRGDVVVELAGTPRLPHRLAAAAPVIDLRLRRRPRFHGSTFSDVRPGDRLALWVAIEPGDRPASGPYGLHFRAGQSGAPLLEIPVVFSASAEVSRDR